MKIKKAIFYSAIFTFILIGCQDEKNNSASDLDQLQGNVKVVEQEVYEAEEKFGEIVKGKKDFNSGLDWVLYDKEGKILETKDFDHESGKMIRKEIYEYDDEAKLVQRKRFDSIEKFQSKWVFHYNSDGQLTEEIKHNQKGIEERKSEYTYDKKGNRISEKTFHTELTKPGTYYTFSYDSKSRMVGQNSFSPTGEKDHRVVFKYNGDLLKEVKSFNEDGLWFVYSFDDKGLLIEEKSYNPDKTVSYYNTYEYVFDSHNNWIEKTMFMNSGEYIQNKPVSITIREIEYYD